MIKTVVCEKCGSTIRYEDKSIVEGNRDFEEVNCQICGNNLDCIFTDLIPDPMIVKISKER